MTNLQIKNHNIDNIIAIAKDDIERLKSSEGWLNASLDRYECFFSRDAITSSLALLQIDPSIAKATLRKLQATQGREFNYMREEEKGRVVHEYRTEKNEHYFELIEKGMDFPFYGTSDATLLYIYLAQMYVKNTKDNLFIHDLAASLMLALEWILSKVDANGLVRVEQINKTGVLKHLMINQSWLDNPKALSYKDGSLPVNDESNYPAAYLEIQGYFIALIENMGYIADEIDALDPTIIPRLQKILLRTKENIEKLFYIPEEDYYAPAIDNHNNKFSIVTSIPAYLLFVHAATQIQAERIKKRILQQDSFTDYGIRTLASTEKQFNVYSYQQGAVWPHDNWIAAQGFFNYGFKDEAAQIKQSIYKAVFHLGVIPELYNVSIDNHLFITDSFDVSVTDDTPLMSATGMSVQAWSCAAILAFESL